MSSNLNDRCETIWALFSVDNAHDQPPHNLVAWWISKPTFDEVAVAMGLGNFPCKTDNETLVVVNVWQSEVMQTEDGTRWTLCILAEGIVKDELNPVPGPKHAKRQIR